MPGLSVANRAVWALLFAALLATAVALGAWHEARSARDNLRSQFVAEELQSMQRMLKDNQALISELQAEPFAEKDSGILASYLSKIRRDGLPKHADMKQRLDTLADNNTAIVALIKVYGPHAKTPAFVSDADQFRNYASAWRDRWNSVMEIFMAGGTFAVAGAQFPTAFAASLDAEIAAAK